MRRSPLAGLVLAALFAVPAWAAPPLIHPTRDVAVTYEVHGGPDGTGAPHQIRMFWTDHGNLVRVDVGGPMGWAVIDFARRRMLLVLAAEHSYLQMPLDPDRTPGLFAIPPGTELARVGTRTIAGQGCTLWNVHSPKDSGTVCLTQDGLLLSASGHGSVSEEGQPVSGSGGLRATAVAYGPQDAAMFTPPAGFQAITVPHMGPGAGPAPAAPRP